MSEEKLYNIIEAALSGVQYVEKWANSLREEIRDVECCDKEINTGILREGMFAISDAVDEIETLLYDPLMIRKEERKTAVRYEAIKDAARTLAFFERPELIDEELPPEDAEIFYENFSHCIRE